MAPYFAIPMLTPGTYTDSSLLNLEEIDSVDLWTNPTMEQLDERLDELQVCLT